MAEFGARQTEAGDIRNAVTPQAGVRPAVDQASVALQGANNIFKTARAMRQDAREAEGNAAVSRFTTEQLKLIQAVDQGKMSSRAARTRMRANLINNVTNNPGMRDAFISANSDLLGAGGMGGMITDGTKEELRRERLRDDLVSGGLVSPDADENEFRQAETQFMKAARAQQQYDEEMEEINMAKARVGLSTAELNNLDARERRAAENMLVQSAPAQMNQFKNTAENLLNLIGQPGYDEATVVRMIEERYNQFEQEMAGPLSQASSATGEALMKGYREWKELALKRARGEYDKAAFDREQQRIIDQQQLVALQDERIAKLVAASELGIPADVMAANVPAALGAMSDYFNSNNGEGDPANLMSSDPQQREAIQNYLGMISYGSDLTDAQREEQIKHFRRIFEGVEDYETIMAKSPDRGIELVSNWMSRQEFFRLRQENPELVTDNAMRIIQSNYGDEVWGMIKRQFREGNIWYAPQGPETPGQGPGRVQLEGRDSNPTNSLVGARRASNGMEFFALDESDQAKAEARRLNRNLAPVINKNIKAFAHLEGTNDYGGYWERVSGQYLEGEVVDDGDEDLETSDFQEQMENMERTGAIVGDVQDAGPGYTVVQLADGTTERREGTRAWRNNNPGNIEFGDFARSQGAVGSDGRFAVFPSYEAGRKAKENLLFETSSYRNRTIGSAIARYAPSFENDTQWYAETVAQAAGVDVNTRLSQLSPQQRQQMLDAMERVEGFQEGTVQRG